MKKMRNSNYELLRIVSMFFIVLYHTIVHGHIISNSNNGTLSIIIFFVELVTLVHVNSFVLVTGYYQSGSKFKFSKVWSITNASWFYKVVTLIVLTSLGFISLNKLEIIKQLSLLNLDQYWFIQNYIFLYCVSPFINKLISNLSKDYYEKLLGVLFVILCIIPFITGMQGFGNNGYSLYSFVFLYLVGAYIRKYPIEKNYFFRRMSKQLLQLTLISIFFACIFSNLCLLATAYSFRNVNNVFAEIYNNVNMFSVYYSNPFVVIQTLAFFCFFGTLSINSKFINKLSSLTLGIYLIHDNNFTRKVIYNILRVDRPVFSCRFILYVLLVAIFIFVVCAIIEQIRQLLFNFIYNRKISKKLRTGYNYWVQNIKISKAME